MNIIQLYHSPKLISLSGKNVFSSIILNSAYLSYKHSFDSYGGGSRVFKNLMQRFFLIVIILGVTQPVLAAQDLVISVLGDSLTAGFQLSIADAFPAQLERALRAGGHKVRLQNAGVSGDTVEDGLARLDWAIGADVDAVIVELGSNDALRGHAPERVFAALDKILMRLKARNLPVLLTSLAAPRNMGPAYVSKFDAIYSDLAKKHNVILSPFFLDGIVANRQYLLFDGLHPNTKGVAMIVRNIQPFVEKLIVSANTLKNQK